LLVSFDHWWMQLMAWEDFIHVNILPPMPRSSKSSLSFGIPTYAFLISHVCYMSHPSHPPRFYHPNNICWRGKLWSSTLCSFLQHPVTSFLLGSNILLSSLKHPQSMYMMWDWRTLCIKILSCLHMVYDHVILLINSHSYCKHLKH
jgi:hypothetical protein